jgi:hypothetical protein
MILIWDPYFMRTDPCARLNPPPKYHVDACGLADVGGC